MKITVNNEAEPLMIESKTLHGENERAVASISVGGSDNKKTSVAKTPDEEGSKLLSMLDKSDRKLSSVINAAGVGVNMYPAATIIDRSKPRNSSFGGTTTGNELTVYSSSIPSSTVKPGTKVLTLISTRIKSAPNDFMGNYFLLLFLFIIFYSSSTYKIFSNNLIFIFHHVLSSC